ncbi:MAG: ubiquinone biosynthesis protein UbiB [Deltaproteobacteria bacterium]|nr:ubiquinone biosynthesis protein UbiB [Deltaproteobacteria bacterium]
MRSLRSHPAYKNVKRLRDIVTVLVRHGFQPLMESLHLARLISLPLRIAVKKITREQEALTPAVRARLAMEELGPTFIKLGQILSTRPDVVPHEFIIEFLKLQDSVAPFPFKDVVAVIEEQFKRPASELFASIDETPVAAASIAQVHNAVTLSGREVAIKVQRPNIDRVVDTDIVILGFIARLAHRYIPESRLYDPVGVVEEFSGVIRREMDFTLEASYMEKFRENFAEDPRVAIPEVIWELTGRKVLTMERVSGIKVDNIARLREKGIDTRKVAHLLADTFFKQVFEHGLFHGDLHSGNIFIMDEDRLALVDFGIVGRVSPLMKQNLADILISFVSEDFEAITNIYQKMGILPEGIDRARFEREYYDIIVHYFGRPFKYVRIGELLLDYIRIAARHEIRLPRELLLFDKCIIELEGLAKLLYPEANILEEGEPYAARLYAERMKPSAFLKNAKDMASGYGEFLQKFPNDMGRVMRKIIEDRLSIDFRHRGLEDFMGEIDRSSNRLTFGIIVAALVVGSSMIIASDAAPKVMGVPVLGLIGFVIASFMGLWLAIQILRSGKF